MATPLTKDHLDEAARDLARHFATGLGSLRQHIDEQFAQVNTKLDAIMSGEVLVTRDQLHDTIRKLARELKAKGIDLDESKILGTR
jgi:hypothetical protein